MKLKASDFKTFAWRFVGLLFVVGGIYTILATLIPHQYMRLAIVVGFFTTILTIEMCPVVDFAWIRKMFQPFVGKEKPLEYNYRRLDKSREESSSPTRLMVRTAEGAFERGNVVEAYFWVTRARLMGERDVARNLIKYQNRWLESGCPREEENVRLDFSEECGIFAIAVLNIESGIGAAEGLKVIKQLAKSGLEEAKLYLRLYGMKS